MLDNCKIGNQITLLRKEKGLTGEKFAEILGVSAQAVSKWENGKNLPETSLLPLLSDVLGTSIDALLMPQELLILSAIYTDGRKTINVTNTISILVKRNRLNIIVNPLFLGASLENDRIAVLTLKYQIPHGTFYCFALQDTNLSIDLDSKGVHQNDNFDIVGAYYGNKNVFKSVMQKMHHYEYFSWNEIHVNHENFPSSPCTDGPEFLVLIYSNSKGLHVISCEENETLCYTEDRKEIFLKDTSTCIIPNIMTLEWDKGIDCTWGGAMYVALKNMGEEYSYEQIMGMSGACYRIGFTEVWDWSATDALVAFDYADILFKSIGYEQIWADRIEKENRHTERQNIVNDIQHGKLVVAINLRIAPEWGVITGYSENGKKFYCRTYFDKEYLNDNCEYLETDSWPFLLIHFGKIFEKPSEIEILRTSLKALVDSFEAPCNRGYWQGKQAYEKWIEGLLNDTLWRKSNSKDDIERRLGVNDSTLLNLIDARKCAAKYLKESVTRLESEDASVLSDIASAFHSISVKLEEFRTKLKANIFPESIDLKHNVTTKTNSSTCCRSEQASLLNEVLKTEYDIVKKAKLILRTVRSSSQKDIL